MAIDLSFGSLNAIRDALTALNALIDHLRTQRRLIALAPAHADDIIAAYREGLERAVHEYEIEVTDFSTDPRLSGVDTDLFGTGAAVYFLRDVIASKIPSLVERLCPGANSGMKLADRAKALAEVNAALNRVWTERDGLRQRLVVERHNLRELRQQATHENDWKARTTLEAEERVLDEELTALRQSQDELRQHAAGRA